MSKLAVIGLVAGGAAGAGAAVVLSRKEADPPPAGTVSAITPSQTGGVQAATAFSFSVQVTGFDVGSTTYRWEFGDGQESTDGAPTHTYNSAGTFSVAVTVRDARQSIRSETPVTVHSITGTWLDPNASTGGSATLQLTQSGTTITGVASWETGAGNLPYSPCPALRLGATGDARPHPLAAATMPASAVRQSRADGLPLEHGRRRTIVVRHSGNA